MMQKCKSEEISVIKNKQCLKFYTEKCKKVSQKCKSETDLHALEPLIYKGLRALCDKNAKIFYKKYFF